MKTIKQFLFRALGTTRYLQLVSNWFLIFYTYGFLRYGRKDLYFLPKLVKNGDTVIDIGGNLGYFAVPLSRIVGAQGRVLSVEPIPLFAGILQKNLRHSPFQNVVIHNIALGKSDQKTVRMATPIQNGVLRHGMTNIITNSTTNTNSTEATYEVPIITSSELFKDLERLDFVKCDVEGFEANVMEDLKPLLLRFKPMIEVEISHKNKAFLWNFFQELNYECFELKNGELAQVKDIFAPHVGDYYFLQP
jgi:FkbM family methyltransferase